MRPKINENIFWKDVTLQLRHKWENHTMAIGQLDAGVSILWISANFGIGRKSIGISWFTWLLTYKHFPFDPGMSIFWAHTSWSAWRLHVIKKRRETFEYDLHKIQIQIRRQLVCDRQSAAMATTKREITYQCHRLSLGFRFKCLKNVVACCVEVYDI